MRGGLIAAAHSFLRDQYPEDPTAREASGVRGHEVISFCSHGLFAEDAYDFGIELGSGAAAEFRESLIKRDRLPVRPITPL